MKGKSLSAIGLLAAIAGVLLIIFNSKITSTGIVVTGGILFVAVGICNLIIFGQRSKETVGMARLFNQITNAAAIVLGICMLVFVSTFVPLVAFIFGLLIAVCSLWQFFLLAVGMRPYVLPAWHYLFPVLLAGICIYIFMRKEPQETEIMIATGIAMALLGIGCMIEGSALGMARRRDIKAKKESAAGNGAETPSLEESVKEPQHSQRETEKTIKEEAETGDEPLK